MATIPLRDLSEFHDPDLYLPINGKRYRIAAPTRETVKELREFVDKPRSVEAVRAAAAPLLGSALDEMTNDDLPQAWIDHAGRTAIVHYALGATLAAANWHFGPAAEAIELEADLAVARDLVGRRH